MTDNVLPMPPRVAVSGVAYDARLVVRDDGAVILWVPLLPFRAERRMQVGPNVIVLIDEETARHAVPLTQIHAALLWLANLGPRP